MASSELNTTGSTFESGFCSSRFITLRPAFLSACTNDVTSHSYYCPSRGPRGDRRGHATPRPVLGIEPAANVAKVAAEKGVPTLVRFFGRELAQELRDQGRQADLLLGNNVLAQVPDLNDFVAGMTLLLAPGGVVTMEFPHLLRLMEGNQFDTIYHEHFSYFSFTTVERIFAHHGLALFDVAELPTHGGSLRIYARHQEDGSCTSSPRVLELRDRERLEGFLRLETYCRFGEQVKEAKRRLLEFLIAAKRRVARSSATARREKATHCSTIAASGLTFSSTPSIAILTSTAGSHPARTFRFSHPTGSARRSRTTC